MTVSTCHLNFSFTTVTHDVMRRLGSLLVKPERRLKIWASVTAAAGRWVDWFHGTNPPPGICLVYMHIIQPAVPPVSQSARMPHYPKERRAKSITPFICTQRLHGFNTQKMVLGAILQAFPKSCRLWEMNRIRPAPHQDKLLHQLFKMLKVWIDARINHTSPSVNASIWTTATTIAINFIK